MPPTADSVCHVAGFPIRVGTVIRQRCAWCGASLSVADAEELDGTTVEFPAEAHEDTWAVGGFVRRTSDGRGVVGIIWQDALPIDACSAAAV
jgi:hypothetical protein